MEFFGDCSAANNSPTLEDAHPHSGGGQVASTNEAIVAATQNEDVVLSAHPADSLPSVALGRQSRPRPYHDPRPAP